MTDELRLEVDITGDVVERQELLNGTEILTLEGRSEDGGWTFFGGLSWNIGRKAVPAEGDITLTSGDGDEIFGTVAGGGVRDTATTDDADHLLALLYDIDGGTGQFAVAAGALHAEGSLRGDTFRMRLSSISPSNP
jgi:hypothetical protein